MLGRGVSGVVSLSLSELTVDILNAVQCAHRQCTAKKYPAVRAVSERKGAMAGSSVTKKPMAALLFQGGAIELILAPWGFVGFFDLPNLLNFGARVGLNFGYK